MTNTSRTKNEPFTLPTLNGKKIYGVRTFATAPSDKVVVLAHGLTGEMFQHLLIEATDYFTEKGYDVVRLNFYDMANDARNLEETTVQIHADDLNIVCDHFRPFYKKMYCAGHSYGGTTLLLANPKADAISFWDATFFPISMHWKNRKRLEGTTYYTCGWGTTVLISEAMYKEAFELDTKSYAKKIQTPSQVIIAENNEENDPKDALYQELICEKRVDIIEGADHRFLAGNTCDTLLTKTWEWFNQH